MRSITTTHPSKPAAPGEKPDAEEIVRQLEKFPREALEAALLMLRSLKQDQTG